MTRDHEVASHTLNVMDPSILHVDTQFSQGGGRSVHFGHPNPPNPIQQLNHSVHQSAQAVAAYQNFQNLDNFRHSHASISEMLMQAPSPFDVFSPSSDGPSGFSSESVDQHLLPIGQQSDVNLFWGDVFGNVASNQGPQGPWKAQAGHAGSHRPFLTQHPTLGNQSSQSNLNEVFSGASQANLTPPFTFSQLVVPQNDASSYNWGEVEVLTFSRYQS